MPRRKLQKRPVTQYTRKDIPRLRALLREDRGWTLEQFAYHLGKLCGKSKGFSDTYVKRLQSGERTLTRKIELALNQLEQQEAYYYREITDENTQTLEWLVTALERRKEELTGELITRLKRIVEHK